MTEKAIVFINRIWDWYLMEHDTYIKIYRARKAPHLLPRFVPEELVLQEVAYQIMINRVWEVFYQDNKSIWTPLRSTSIRTSSQPKNRPGTKWIYCYCTTLVKKGL
jgi:hypothetical protein